MANLQSNTAPGSNVYKAFFDDATLSDLTVRLSDRSVRVHRIVLCRQSRYFFKLLTGRFQESGSKEIELKEDDPESMVALLRYIYDLPYSRPAQGSSSRLHPLAMLYVVAEKYEVEGLKLAVRDSMESIINPSMDFHDFIGALKVIIIMTTPHSDNHARHLMVRACAVNLQTVRQDADFSSLLREHADLGAEIIEHQDLECGLPGGWVCKGFCAKKCTMTCWVCGEAFSNAFAWENRDKTVWSCEECGSKREPRCKSCSRTIVWQRRVLQ